MPQADAVRPAISAESLLSVVDCRTTARARIRSGSMIGISLIVPLSTSGTSVHPAIIAPALLVEPGADGSGRREQRDRARGRDLFAYRQTRLVDHVDDRHSTASATSARNAWGVFHGMAMRSAPAVVRRVALAGPPGSC
ncbi:MAG TPA: hypothetical protein VK816_11665 [Jatrophihabitantaceae bacterium]|nr:hypothetical protein [Jatrophihabitantaceae bacterium]